MPSPAARRSACSLAVALAFAGASFAADVAPGTASDAGSESWLLVLEAAKVEVQGEKLVLSGLPETVLAFADRPARQVLRPDLATIAAFWSDLFGDDSPNAAITWPSEGAAGESKDQVIELWRPLRRGATLEFSYRVLGAAPQRLASIAKGGTPLPATMSKVSLFIDGVDLNPKILQGGGIQCWPFHNSPTMFLQPCAKQNPEMSCTCLAETDPWCGSTCTVNCCRPTTLVDCETLCSIRPQVCIPNPDGT